eukprot:COSAG03_NODE_1639_length_3730_cov_8.308455_1_plen_230_part_00
MYTRRRSTSYQRSMLLLFGLLSHAWLAAVSAPGGGVLLPCGSTASPGEGSRQVLDVFKFVNGVCAQRGESCPPGSVLPASCASAECQRAVQLATDSCTPVFAKNAFLKTAFGKLLDAAAAVCAVALCPADSQVRPMQEPCPLCFHATDEACFRCCLNCCCLNCCSDMPFASTRKPAVSWRCRRRPTGCSPTEWEPAAATSRCLDKICPMSPRCKRGRGRWFSWTSTRCG